MFVPALPVPLPVHTQHTHTPSSVAGCVAVGVCCVGMPRINFSRTERFAQMSKQEQLIAQKRQQILEKQRTLELAKQIAAEATKDTTR